MAINTISDALAPDIKSSLFEDNLFIQHSSRNTRTSSGLIQKTIKKLEDWANTAELRLSAAKNVVVNLWHDMNGGATRNYKVLKLYDEDIPRRETTKRLGMTLDLEKQ